MAQLDFKSYRREMESHLRVLAANYREHELDEQAVPSYIHKNRLMAWLFWQRLWVVMKYLDQQPLECVLDFGCGTGVMFPFLLSRSNRLFGFDIDPKASHFTIQRLGLNEIVILDSWDKLVALQPGSINTIIALDVLEHVEDLDGTCRAFAQLLSPEGQILVSGPSESLLYRTGRWLAGFKHHFHVRTIYDIEECLAKYFTVQVIAKLYSPLTLFRINVARPKNQHSPE